MGSKYVGFMSMITDMFQNQHNPTIFTLKKMLSSWQPHLLNNTENDLKMTGYLANAHVSVEFTQFLPDHELTDDVKYNEFVKSFDSSKTTFLNEVVTTWSHFLSRPECTPIIDFLDHENGNPKLHTLPELFPYDTEPEFSRWKQNRTLRAHLKLGRAANHVQRVTPFSFEEAELLDTKAILQLRADIDELENPTEPPEQEERNDQQERPQNNTRNGSPKKKKPLKRKYGAKGHMFDTVPRVSLKSLDHIEHFESHLSVLIPIGVKLINVFRMLSNGGKVLSMNHCPIAELVSILFELFSSLRSIELQLSKRGENINTVMSLFIESPIQASDSDHEYKPILNLASDIMLNIGQVLIVLSTGLLSVDSHSSNAFGSCIDLYVYLLHFESVKLLLDGQAHSQPNSWVSNLIPKISHVAKKFTDRNYSRGNMVRAYLYDQKSFDKIASEPLFREHAPVARDYVWLFDAIEIHSGLSWLLNIDPGLIKYDDLDTSGAKYWKLDETCLALRKKYLEPHAHRTFYAKYDPKPPSMGKALQMDEEIRDTGVKFGMKRRYQNDFEEPEFNRPYHRKRGEGWNRGNRGADRGRENHVYYREVIPEYNDEHRYNENNRGPRETHHYREPRQEDRPNGNHQWRGVQGQRGRQDRGRGPNRRGGSNWRDRAQKDQQDFEDLLNMRDEDIPRPSRKHREAIERDQFDLGAEQVERALRASQMPGARQEQQREILEEMGIPDAEAVDMGVEPVDVQQEPMEQEIPREQDEGHEQGVDALHNVDEIVERSQESEDQEDDSSGSGEEEDETGSEEETDSEDSVDAEPIQGQAVQPANIPVNPIVVDQPVQPPPIREQEIHQPNENREPVPVQLGDPAPMQEQPVEPAPGVPVVFNLEQHIQPLGVQVAVPIQDPLQEFLQAALDPAPQIEIPMQNQAVEVVAPVVEGNQARPNPAPIAVEPAPEVGVVLAQAPIPPAEGVAIGAEDQHVEGEGERQGQDEVQAQDEPEGERQEEQMQDNVENQDQPRVEEREAQEVDPGGELAAEPIIVRQYNRDGPRPLFNHRRAFEMLGNDPAPDQPVRVLRDPHRVDYLNLDPRAQPPILAEVAIPMYAAAEPLRKVVIRRGDMEFDAGRADHRYGLTGTEDFSVVTYHRSKPGQLRYEVSTTVNFPYSQNEFNRRYGNPVENAYVTSVMENTGNRYSRARVVEAIQTYRAQVQGLSSFRNSTRPQGTRGRDLQTSDEINSFYEEPDKESDRRAVLAFQQSRDNHILVEGRFITTFRASATTLQTSPQRVDRTIPLIYPLQLSRSWIDQIGSLKLLWVNRSNQGSCHLNARRKVHGNPPGARQVLSVGVALVNDNTLDRHQALLNTLVRFVVDRSLELISNPVPATSVFVSKDRHMHNHYAEALTQARFESGERNRELEVDKYMNTTSVELVMKQLSKKFLDIQPVMTSRPAAVVPCDLLYNKSHPIEKLFVEHSSKFGTTFFRSHHIGTVEECYPAGCPDIMMMRANDVHYYFDNNTLRGFPETELYLTGMNYTHQWPGTYRYNWNCGSYKIYPDQDVGRGLATYKIDVLTAGSGGSNLYSHPLTTVCNTTKEMELGWVAVIEYTGSAEAIRFDRVVGPRYYDPDLNPQALWMLEQSTKTVSLDLTGQFSRNLPNPKELKSAYSRFVDCIQNLYFVRGPEDLQERVTYLTGLMGARSPAVFSFRRKDLNCLTKFLPCCKKVWHVSKTQALIPDTSRNLGWWRRLLSEEKNVALFDKYQSLRSNFGAKKINLEWTAQDHEQVAMNYDRIEVAEKQSDLWERPCTTLHIIKQRELEEQLKGSVDKEKQIVKSTRSKNEDAHEDHEQPVALEMVPLYCEVRKLTREGIVLSRSSDNVENAKLVKVLKSNAILNAPVENRVKNYPKVGYTACTSNLRTVHNWTIDDQNPISMLSAIHARHFSAQLTPDPNVVDEFNAFTDEYIGGIASEVNEMLKRVVVTNNFVEHYSAKDYSNTKKDDYIRNCYAQLFHPEDQDFSFSFMGMVKSGEINYTKGELIRDELGYLISGSERARLIWNPSQSGKGLLNFVQHYIFDALHIACPDFIHGASVGDIRDATLERTERLVDPMSISLDGSSYDSTQFAELMEAVDSKFFNGIKEGLHSVLQSCAEKHNAPEWKIEFTDTLIRSAIDSNATLFASYPSTWLKQYKMTDDQKSLLKRHWPRYKPKPGYATAAYNVDGTTFSGHPTKTTLGNTLRTLAYYRFAFKDLPRVQMMAAGDDVVCWIERKDIPQAIERVSYISKKDAAIGEHGLGQVVKSVEAKEKFQLDFCSKNFFYTNQSGLVVTRDVEKLMKTKLSAQTKYEPFIRDPQAYMTLIYKSALAEIPCPLIHSMLKKRVVELGGLKDPTPEQERRYRILEKANYKRHQDENFHFQCTDQDLQDQILERTKIYEVDVFDYAFRATNTLRFGLKTPFNLVNYNTTNQPHMSYKDYQSYEPYSESDRRDSSRSRNYGPKGQRDYYYPEHKPRRNPGSQNQSFASQQGVREPQMTYRGPAGKGRKFKKTVTENILGKDPKTHAPVEQTKTTTTTTGPSGTTQVKEVIYTEPAETVSFSSQPKPKRPQKVAIPHPLMADQSWMIPINQRQKVSARNVAAMNEAMNTYTEDYDWDTMAKERSKIRNAARSERLAYYTSHPQPGTLAPFNSNGPLIQDSVNEALSDTDRFMLAKFMPGKIDTPFMNGLQRVPIPTGKFSTSFSLDTAARAANPDSGQSPLGTDPYLLLAFCPALSLSLGSGVANAQSTTTHLSGFASVQGALNDQVLYTDIFDRSNRSPSLFALLGTNFDSFSSNGLIFSSQIDMRLMCPAANLVGAMYTGACTLASIPSGGLSFAKLLQTSSRVESGATNLALRGALVNNGLVTTALTPNSNDTFADFSNEIVHYIILQNPVVSITTGNPAPYSLIANAHGNYVWWPTQLDAFANKLGAGDVSTANIGSSSKQSFLSDSIYTPLLDAGKLVGRNLVSTAGNIARNLVGSIPLIGSTLSQAFGASFKARVKPHTENEIVWCEKAWAYRWMDEFIRLQESVQILVFKQVMDDLRPKIDLLRAYVDAYENPLVPVTISWMEVEAKKEAKSMEEKCKNEQDQFKQPKLIRTKPLELTLKQVPLQHECQEDNSFHTIVEDDMDSEAAMEKDAMEYSKFRLMKQSTLLGGQTANAVYKSSNSNPSSRQTSNEPNQTNTNQNYKLMNQNG